jgi:REP element-mobilizing transposase RayT
MRFAPTRPAKKTTMTKFDPDIHHRRSIRLKGYDYALPGMYFITICTFDRKCILGEITGKEMKMNGIGQLVMAEWIKTPSIRPNFLLGEFVVMPNHLHGLVMISGDQKKPEKQYGRDGKNVGRNEGMPRSPSGTIGALVRGFKAAATRQFNELRGTKGLPLWQRNYWEHVVRSEEDLNHIRSYIRFNPARWESDRLNPLLSFEKNSIR